MGDRPRRPSSVASERFALQAWSNAEIHLAEAMALQPDVTPNGMAHIAYYAMFHAARAVFLRLEGSAPKKHASVRGQFSLLAQSRYQVLREAARSLNETEEKRIIADYRDGESVSPGDAREALNRAIAFLDVCSREFGFARKAGGNA
jgi:uncharacterized protein (UPF0332 family)